MMNPAKILKLKGAWDKFTQNHPKFPMFMNAIRSQGIEEGAVIEIIITSPEGKALSTNLKVSQTDKELFTELVELSKSK
ncbi:MAG: hypothetical protein K0R00_2881 [Herbinix sp.]|jgi:hypothetical protein|nr:hypothetical protein [Herbinix sp.]